MTDLLQVNDLRTYFDTEEGTVKAVDGISFSIEKGKTLGIVGESGCGKSVTALSLMQLLRSPPARIQAGEILFDGQDLLKLAPDAIRALRGGKISMIFQEPMTSLNPVLRIGFQIAEAIQAHLPDLPFPKVEERVVELLRLVGIGDAEKRYHDFPHQLSGGLRQRVMIAMALSCDPDLLVADEPTTALDVTIQAQILELIQNLQKQRSMSVILITHDLGLIAEVVDEVLVMYAGVVVEKADVKSLFADPLHPYTRGLLRSLPTHKTITDGKRQKLHTIEGNVPSGIHTPEGCRFYNRCEVAMDSCRPDEPKLVERKPGHWVRCIEGMG